MSKVITKIELDEKIICSKVLLLDESLYSIRNKIKEKTKNINFQFLDVDGNRIEIKNENDLKLINALNDGKIKIISIENKELIKIIMNGKEFGYKNLFQKQNLDEVRNILKSEINQDFIFKDLKGINIQKENEKYFSIKDVLDNQSINLEFNNQLPVSEFDSKSFPGVNTCISGMLSIIARYSFLAGSITKNGILCSFHNLSSKLTENVVLPEPGVPTINICFVKSPKENPILS